MGRHNTPQLVKEDGNGNWVFSEFPNSPPDGFNKIEDQFSSSMKWAVAASVVYGIVGTVAIVLIVYAIIDCLKRVGSAVPAYAKIATSEPNTEEVSRSKLSSLSNEDQVLQQQVLAVSSSRAEFKTVERFLSNIAREKPVRFSSAQLEEFTDNFSTVLGSGGFGVVFKGLLPNGVHLAVKSLSNNWDKRVEEQFMAEVGTLGRTYHINLVRLYGFCFDSSLKALVYEYMENGSLENILFSTDGREIDLEKLHDIAVQTAKGLAYLHEECERKIIHYDIKPGNVLLDKNLNPKVADFGLAKLCSRETSQTTLMVDGRGTPGYAAPEMWKPYPVTQKCDVYSFGILLFEIVARRRHFDDSVIESRQWLPKWTWDIFEHKEIAVMISLCGIEERNKEKAERMLMVALWCIQNSPTARPLMSNVVQMLEGSKEVTPPPCPFEHRQSPRPSLSSGQSGTNDDSSNSYASSANTLKENHSNPVHNTFEIELDVE